MVAEEAAALASALRAASSGSKHAAVIRSGPVKQIPKLAFVFSGMGSQYPAMGAELYAREPVFRQTIDLCDSVLRPIAPFSLREVLCTHSTAHPVDDTQIAQPALFAFEFALAKLWSSWGVVPEAVIGHSLGEYVAACLAGVMSLDDALRVVTARGRLIGSLPAGSAMASLRLTEAATRAFLRDAGLSLEIAALNGRERTVVSGGAGELEALVRAASDRGIECQLLRVSHAFHSRQLEPILDEFERVVGSVRLSAPTLPVISNLTGRAMTPEQACSPRYWRQHAREAVRFLDGVRVLPQLGISHYLEIGPHAQASALVSEILESGGGACVLASCAAGSRRRRG